jgi:signal peptidase I
VSPARRWASDLCESLLLALVLVFLILRPFVVQSFFIPSGSMRPTLREGDRLLVNKMAYRLHAPRRGDVVVFRAPAEADTAQKDYIKRLVGLPGDVVEVRPGLVQVGDDPPFTRDSVRAVLGGGRSIDQQLADAAHSLRLTTDALWLDGRRVDKEAFARAAGRPGWPVRIVPGRVLLNGVTLCETYVAEDPGYPWGPAVVPPGALFVLGDNRNESHDSHDWGMLPAGRVIGRADCIFWPPGRAGLLR